MVEGVAVWAERKLLSNAGLMTSDKELRPRRHICPVFVACWEGGARYRAFSVNLTTSRNPSRAFSFVELLVVIAILVVIVGMFWPTPSHIQIRPMMGCMSNLRQTAIGFTMWSDDNGRSSPWQISTNHGGTLEMTPNGRAADQFLTLSNYLKHAQVFVCPTDQARHATNSYSSFGNQNLSYFAGLGALANSSNSSLSILSGDRHLQVNAQPVKPGLLVASNSATFGWTKELHERGSSSPVGNLLFADGHVEIARSARLTSSFQRQSPLTNRLVIP